MIPGLDDVHMHLSSYGAIFNREVRWDDVRRLKTALDMVKAQAARTPKGEWVRVIGGWTPYQFAEKRLPIVAELDAISSTRPIMVTHLWDRIIYNHAGLRAMGIDRSTPDPEGARILKDASGEPTGVVLAVESWDAILGAIGKLPAPASLEERKSGTQQYMRVLNSYGLTSVIDSGAGAYPDSYEAVIALRNEGKMTVRVAGTLYPPLGADEKATFDKWLSSVKLNMTDPYYRIFGAGENLEAEFRPILQEVMRRGWGFRLHASYDETITRMLNVIEEESAKTPMKARWSVEHAETLSDANIARIKKLGGGRPRRLRHRLDADCQLQPLGHALLFRGGQRLRRQRLPAARQAPDPRRSAQAGDDGQHLVQRRREGQRQHQRRQIRRLRRAEQGLFQRA